MFDFAYNGLLGAVPPAEYPRCPVDPECRAVRYERELCTRQVAHELIVLRRAGQVCKEHAKEIRHAIVVICDGAAEHYKHQKAAEAEDARIEGIAGRAGYEANPYFGRAARVLRLTYLLHAKPYSLLEEWDEAGYFRRDHV